MTTSIFRRSVFAASGALFLLPMLGQAAEATLSVAGDWQVQLQPGVRASAWNDAVPAQKIQLPGSLQAQGLGDEISVNTKWIGGVADRSWYTAAKYEKYRQPGNVKIPFWLQPDRHFVGAATYRRTIEVPQEWAGKRVVLSLERVHISTKVWLDGQEIGTGNSLSTPHRFDLGHLAPGRHALAIGIDNLMPTNIGENSHCVSDHMQTNWNGIVGKLQLETTPDAWIDGLETYPDVAGKQVRVKWLLGGKPVAGKIALSIQDPAGKTFAGTADAGAGETMIPLGNAIAAWDEFSPRLYRVEATLTLPDGATHQASSTFGMVDYKVDGRHFLVNGRPTVFRGTLDCAMYPLTGYPSMDVAYWKKEIAVLKAHGFNHIRFHSWCPPEAAFIAADELGCYLQVEHAWTAPASAGDYLMAEAERVIRIYGNHPSFAMHTYGNEPSGGNEWLNNFSGHFRKLDPRRYYSGAAGRDAFKDSQYSLPQGSDIRVYSWGSGLRSSINSQVPNTVNDFRGKTQACPIPVVCHEAGQWCVYPDFDEIKKYTGFLKAKNFEVFRDFLEASQMGDQAHDFLMASGHLQTLCYKYEIEKLLRTPDIGGYQLLGLNDFPGQGTALVGAVNPFWETKPYTTPAEYMGFAGPSVPLARLPKFVFKGDETLVADLELSHYAATPLAQAVPIWKLVDAAGKTVRSGKLSPRDIPVGQSSLGKIEIPLAGLEAPSQMKLVAGIADAPIENHWDVWVYPAQTPRPDAGNLVISNNPADAWQKAQAGAAVLLIPPAKNIVDPEGAKVVLGFSTIFWNSAWAKNQPPTTLGILCDPKHPALAKFPTDFHSNYQWWYLIQLAKKPLCLEGQDPKLRPVVQVIDDWFTARRLGLVVEANCGKGKLLISAIDFENAKSDDIVAAQLRASLLEYMKSPAFAPKNGLDEAAFAKIVKAQSQAKYTVRVDSEAADYPATNAIDGDPATFWHTEWQDAAPGYPHEISLELAKPAKLAGVRLLPRQDITNGWVKEIEIQVSADGKTWQPAIKASLGNDKKWKQVDFPAAEAKAIRIRCLSPQIPAQPWTCFAEIDPVVQP